MIGYLRGLPRQNSPERVILDVGGVGYEVQTTLTTFYEIDRAGLEQAVELFIITHVRETALELFGFWSESEKALFELLVGITGVGPKLARNILSGSSLAELVTAIRDGDVKRVTKTPGVGKKTAERIVLELHEKVRLRFDELVGTAPAQTATPQQSTEDANLISALVNLGYKTSQAEDAVRQARGDAPEAAFHELLRLSLRSLSRA